MCCADLYKHRPANLSLEREFQIDERLQTLQREKNELLRVIAEFRNNRTSELSPRNESSNSLTYEMEHARRKAENTITELWYFLDSILGKSDTEKGQMPLKIPELRESLQGYKRSLFGDFEKLRTANKADVYRKQRLQELGDLIQRRLEHLQNPTDCNTTKKLVCILSRSCGFACQMHHCLHCVISSYALGRSLVLKSRSSLYASESFDSVFEPMSSSCLAAQFNNTTKWPAVTTPFFLTSEENYSPPRPAFLPPAVPADLAQELSILHGNPSAWWIGQLARYIFRLKQNLLEEVISRGKKAGFTNTIVGIHIRRTDKLILESASYPVEEYMYHVKEYYDQVEQTQPGITRRVYITTDEPTVLSEAIKKYPNYIFINDFNGTRTATMASRNSKESLHGIITDVYHLARCDYLVCTFSSNVCRLAYELMQTVHGDASRNARSLDAIFFFYGQNAHQISAVEVYRSNKKGHIELKPGDVISVAGNHWNGFSR
ncbi:unnamed protein product [Candidula unifasciata]|uniref:GT23 domain-containing protein n=1 Tax=Candidula unifasciata TaxID=100452 RepID=A0A8S3ZDJ5_9EUPU|nr:unnamed protein product [Candidula unifasciata]